MMIYISLALFTIGAALGAFMLMKYVIKKRHVPSGFAIIHGVVVASALILLVVHNVQIPEKGSWLSVGLFVAAALLGSFVFITDLTRNKILKVPLALHIVIAVAGYVNLVCIII
jgi:hypothetical protein